jgi:hypothetical protein
MKDGKFNSLMENGEWRIILVLALIFTTSHALDPMYDYRYTLGPEILVPDAFSFGAGAFSRWNEDLTLVTNIQLGLSRDFEMGIKFMGGTNDDWVLDRSIKPHDPWKILPLINIGGKYAISPRLCLQADVPIALNIDKDWGGVISISQLDGYSKNVSFLFEGRVGFGGAAGKDNYEKISLMYIPYFQIGDAFRLSVGPIGSFSFENYSDNLMLDILPKVEAGFKFFTFIAEVSIGILTLDAEKYNRYSLFMMADI